MWKGRRGVLSALEKHQSASEFDVQMRPGIARQVKQRVDANGRREGLNGNGKML